MYWCCLGRGISRSIWSHRSRGECIYEDTWHHVPWGGATRSSQTVTCDQIETQNKLVLYWFNWDSAGLKLVGHHGISRRDECETCKPILFLVKFFWPLQSTFVHFTPPHSNNSSVICFPLKDFLVRWEACVQISAIQARFIRIYMKACGRMDGYISCFWRTDIPGERPGDQCHLVNNRCCLWEYIFNLTPEVIYRPNCNTRGEMEIWRMMFVRGCDGSRTWAVDETSERVKHTHTREVIVVVFLLKRQSIPAVFSSCNLKQL